MRYGRKARSRCCLSPDWRVSHNARKGFTLVEVLVAIVILSTGIVLVLRALDASVGAFAEARDTMWAAMLLRERIIGATLALRDGSLRPPVARNGRFEGRYADFLWSEEVGILPSSGPVVFCEVVTTVWRDGSSRRFTARTHVAVPEESSRGERERAVLP